MKTKDLIMLAVVAGGGYLAYWYVTKYGPQGAVVDANGNAIAGRVSYWTSWFGSAAALPAPTSTTTTTTTPPVTKTTPPETTTAPYTSTTTLPTNTPTKTTPSGQPIQGPGGLATQSQIGRIQALLQTSDLPAFQAMIPTLTYDQANIMLGNAQQCLNPAVHPPAGGTYNIDGSCSTVTAPQSLREALITAAGNPGTLTVSQWNWYLATGPNPIQPSANTNMDLGDGGVPVDVDTYLSLRASNGLSGVGMIMPVAPGITQSGLTGLAAVSEVRRVRSPWGKMNLRVN